MVCLHGQGEVEPVRTFCGPGRVNFLAILCGRLLWTAPYREVSSWLALHFGDTIKYSV